MTIYSQITANKRRSFVLVFIFVGILVALGYILGIYWGSSPWTVAGVIFLFSTGSAFFSYFFSDKIALSLAGAKEIQEDDNPRLFRTVENLCIGAGLPRPKIFLISDPAPNAFATGRDPKHASIAVTTGLLEKLDKLELEGVIAHELSHIQNYDIRFMTLVVVLVGAVMIISDILMRSAYWGGGRRRSERGGGGILLLVGILLAILSPLIAQLIKLAISRSREYLADASGVLVTRYPEGVAGALEKIGEYNMETRTASHAIAPLYFTNPFREGRWAEIFSTHPPVVERVRRLRAM